MKNACYGKIDAMNLLLYLGPSYRDKEGEKTDEAQNCHICYSKITVTLSDITIRLQFMSYSCLTLTKIEFTKI